MDIAEVHGYDNTYIRLVVQDMKLNCGHVCFHERVDEAVSGGGVHTIKRRCEDSLLSWNARTFELILHFETPYILSASRGE